MFVFTSSFSLHGRVVLIKHLNIVTSHSVIGSRQTDKLDICHTIRIYGEASELALDTTPQLLSERRVCPLVITQKGMSTGRTCFNDPSIPTNKTTVWQLVSTWHFKETVKK